MVAEWRCFSSSIQNAFFKHLPWEISGDGLGNRHGPGCLAYRPAVCGRQNKASRSNIYHVTPHVLYHARFHWAKDRILSKRCVLIFSSWLMADHSHHAHTHTHTHACIYIYTQTSWYTHRNVNKRHLLPSAQSCHALLQGPFARHRPDIYHIKSLYESTFENYMCVCVRERESVCVIHVCVSLSPSPSPSLPLSQWRNKGLHV